MKKGIQGAMKSIGGNEEISEKGEVEGRFKVNKEDPNHRRHDLMMS